ncbi:MAG: phage terminase small subunit P27 family [Proteobacteria bacterium]|nr:phage terminase small subunit P27 family [Pseudomonadota bacterium]
MEPIKRLWPVPKNMEGYGLEFFKRTGKQLVSVGILTDLDRDSFSALASAYNIMMVAQDSINTLGATVAGSQDEIKKNPSFTTYKMGADIYHRLSKRFYLTPGDRAGVTIEKPTVKDNGKGKFFG